MLLSVVSPLPDRQVWQRVTADRLLHPDSLGAMGASVATTCTDGNINFLDVLCIVVDSLVDLLLHVLLDGVRHLQGSGTQSGLAQLWYQAASAKRSADGLHNARHTPC